MSEIKKGALVKAWDDDPSNYALGTLVESYPDGSCGITYMYGWSLDLFLNFSIIPPELVKQLEELGK